MNRVLELRGSDSIATGIEAVSGLMPAAPDIVVVRDVIDADVADQIMGLRTFGRNTLRAEELKGILSKHLPVDAMTELVSSAWEYMKYTGAKTALDFDPYKSLKVESSINPHVDMDDQASRFKVCVTGSLCVSGMRRIHAQRTAEQFRGVDGSYDYHRYISYAQGLSIGANGRPSYVSFNSLQSSVDVTLGDLALWGQNPIITLHGVSNASQDAAAVLLDWYARSER